MDVHIGNMSHADYLFELGKARSLSGNFLGSIRLLEESSNLYLSQKDYFNYMECQVLLLRIYRELQDFQKISALKEELMELIWEENIQITARVHYTLGQCALSKGDLKEALEEFEKSMHQIMNLKEKAKKENDRALLLQAEIESCSPLYGIVSFYIRNEDVRRAQPELQSLQNLLQSFKVLEKQYADGSLQKQSALNIDEINRIKDVLEESVSMRKRIELSSEILQFIILHMKGEYIEGENLCGVVMKMCKNQEISVR